ncbi:11128_t:CDS:2 [Funneliformis geosporum]|nr:11128_t:CDS:2 [Funneliformis geosporum]
MLIDILDAITFVSEAWKIVKSKDPIIAERFIHIDDEIPIELLSEDDIIVAIISSFEKDDNIEENDKLEIDVIFNNEALNSLEKIIQYCKNLSDNVSIDYAELKILNTLKSKINKLVQDNAK